MSFLALLLNALYEPEEEREGEERCPTHPLKKHAYVATPVMEYAAGMNITLAYHKLQDDWLDDKNPVSAAEARLIRRAYDKVAERWPDKCTAIEGWIEAIHRLERANSPEIDPPVNLTGAMLGELFAYRPDDIWAESLRGVGDGLGRFIYFMDAYEDLRADLKRGRYNPLKGYVSRYDYEDFCRAAMMTMAGDAAREYEMLPIVKDADILSNILYSGIWSKYAAIQKRRRTKEEEKSHAGSL